jgi:hypothetical protein
VSGIYNPTKPASAFVTDNFDLAVIDKGSAVVATKGLAGISIQNSPGLVAMEKIEATKPYARFIGDYKFSFWPTVEILSTDPIQLHFPPTIKLMKEGALTGCTINDAVSSTVECELTFPNYTKASGIGSNIPVATFTEITVQGVKAPQTNIYSGEFFVAVQDETTKNFKQRSYKNLAFPSEIKYDY